MWIETTFISYGYGPNGIIGLTLKPETLKRWAYIMHIYSMIAQDIADILTNSGEKGVRIYKEEKPSRIASDVKDRHKMRDKLFPYIDLLDQTDHPVGLIDVVTGWIAPKTINTHDAEDIENDQLKSIEKSWPIGFNVSLSKLWVTQGS